MKRIVAQAGGSRPKKPPSTRRFVSTLLRNFRI